MTYDLSLREKRLIQAAGVLVILFLLYMLLLRGGPAPKTSARDGAIAVRRVSEILAAASFAS